MREYGFFGYIFFLSIIISPSITKLRARCIREYGFSFPLDYLYLNDRIENCVLIERFGTCVFWYNWLWWKSMFISKEIIHGAQILLYFYYQLKPHHTPSFKYWSYTLKKNLVPFFCICVCTKWSFWGFCLIDLMW